MAFESSMALYFQGTFVLTSNIRSGLGRKSRGISNKKVKEFLIQQKIASTIQFCQVNLNAILRYLGIATEMVQKKL